MKDNEIELDKFLSQISSIGTNCEIDIESFVEVTSLDDVKENIWEKCFSFNEKWADSNDLEYNEEENLYSWSDIRENLSSIFYCNDLCDDKEDEIRSFICENLISLTKLEELENDIISDLVLISLNILINGAQQNFWSKLKQIYLSGYIPCGWKGHYPDSKFNVYKINP